MMFVPIGVHAMCPAATDQKSQISDTITNILSARNFYEVLGVGYDVEAGEIRKQYLKKSKLVHPGKIS